jgi:hypothetical protein
MFEAFFYFLLLAYHYLGETQLSLMLWTYLTEDIAALGIGIHDLIVLKAGINQAVKLYILSPLPATLWVIEEIKHNKIRGLDRELRRLSLQKVAITEACARHVQVFVNAAKM